MTDVAGPEHRRRAAWDRLDAVTKDHPVAIAGCVAAIVCAGSLVWLLINRSAGLFDADESRYLGDAVRFTDALRQGPGTLFTQVRATSTAPLVPLLSIPFLLVSGSAPLTAFLVQPVFVVLTACCITSITARLAQPPIAILAGVTFCTSWPVLLGLQSYQYGLAVGAFLALSLVALFSSEEGTNRWIWVVGLALAAMVLSRTMAIAFLPAVLVAAVVTVRQNRRGLTRLAAALFVGTVVAMPWYLFQSQAVFGYLTQYGYGERAGSYGSAGAWAQASAPLGALVAAAGPALVAMSAIASIALVARGSRGPSGIVGVAQRFVGSIALPLAIVVVGGLIPLMTTSNQGGWFVTPLLTPVLVLGAATLSGSGRLLRFAALVALLSQVVANLVLSGWWLIPSSWTEPIIAPTRPTYPESAFSPADRRFSPDSRSEQPGASQEWVEATRSVVDHLAAIEQDGPTLFTLVGNGRMINANSLLFSSLIDDRRIDLETIDTGSDPSTWSERLTPLGWTSRGDEVNRVIVVIDRPEDRFPADERTEDLRAAARRQGWRTVEQVELPSGGIEILRHGS